VPELKVLPARLNNSRDSAVRAVNPKQSSFIASLKEIVKRTFRTGWIKIREPDEVFIIFQKNVAKMIETAKRAQVPIIFIKKAINLQDRNVLTRIRYTIRADENRLGRWLTYYRSGVDNLRNSRYSAALLDLQAVSDLSVVEPPAKNDRLLMLYLGRAYEASGLFDRAVTMYESRMDAYHLGLNRVLDETATEYGVPVIDAYRHLKNDSPTGIVGYNYFVDGVHMTWKGYKVLGTALAAFIEDYGYLPPGSANHEAEGPNTIQDKVKTLIQSPNAEVQTALGWSAFNQGDPYSAVNLATAAVEMDREEIQAHLLLVYAHTKLGNFGHAESSWRDMKRIYLKLVDQEARHAGRR
jgi:tetratricopeptide (TPR) repeat protein